MFNDGLMGPDMKECGKNQNIVEKGSFGMQMGIFMKGNGSTTKQMVLEYTLIVMEQVTQDFLKMICNMERVKSFG